MLQLLATSALSLHLPAAPGRAVGPHRCTDARMGMFDDFAKAFANDDSLGDRDEAGLAQKAEYHTITWQGPPEKTLFGDKPGPVTRSQAIAGQSLKENARVSGVEIPYACNEGTCRICDVKVNGRMLPACVAKMPKKDITIEYFPQGKTAAAAPAPAPAADAMEGVVVPMSLEDKLRAEMEEKKAAKKQQSGAPAFPSFKNPFQTGPSKEELEALRQKALNKNRRD
uniref:2Fe-2S ferredoxin-type domain-containing protein n=1 Tax=Prymnesium polylepis TaxID=72548 RepID=A0A7S4I939_9EUKA